MYLYIALLTAFLVLILLSIKKRPAKDSNYLSKDTTVAEKGIAAVAIVFHHVSQMIDLPKYFVILDYIGFIMVAVFFFISGYGLAYGLENKKGYLNNFFKKRILSILIPYWIINIIGIIYNLSISKVFTPFEYIASFFGLNTVVDVWFVTSILIMYISFWLCYKPYCAKKISWKVSTIILMAIIVIYCIICNQFVENTSFTASISAFALGVVWKKLFNNKFLMFLQKHYFAKLCCITLIFCFTFFGRLLLSYISINSNILHLILRNIVTVCFVLFMLTVSYKFKFNSKIITYFGVYSYEIYICHYLAKTMLAGLADNSYLFITALIVLTTVFSFIVYKISKGLKKVVLR